MSEEQQTISAEDAELKFIADQRRTLIAKLSPNGEVPAEKADKIMLLALLKDQGQQMLTLKRIDADKGIGDKMADAAKFIAGLVADASIKKIYKTNAEDVIENRPAPCLPDEIKPSKIVDGELSIGAPTENYDEFMSRISDKQK